MVIRYLHYPEMRNHPFAEKTLNRLRQYFRHRGWSDGGYTVEGFFIRFNDKANRHINWNRLFWFFCMGNSEGIDDILAAEANEEKPVERFTDDDFDRYIYQFWGDAPFRWELSDGTVVDIRGGRQT